MSSTTCPACGHATSWTTPSTSRGVGACSRCGYASGEDYRCPHCGAVARIDGVGKTAVCAVCSGPRVPASFGGEASAGALKEQKKLLDHARLASFATVVQGFFATIVTLIGLAILPTSILGKAIVFVIALVPLILALRSRSRAKAARKNAEAAGERAWQAAAEDVAAQTKEGITVSALAKALGVEPAYAEQLLTSLTVHDRTRIDVGDDAEVRYSVPPEGLVRISERDPLLEATDALDEESIERPLTQKEPAR